MHRESLSVAPVSGLWVSALPSLETGSKAWSAKVLVGGLLVQQCKSYTPLGGSHVFNLRELLKVGDGGYFEPAPNEARGNSLLLLPPPTTPPPNGHVVTASTPGL